jgi:hypothetical protein
MGANLALARRKQKSVGISRTRTRFSNWQFGFRPGRTALLRRAAAAERIKKAAVLCPPSSVLAYISHLASRMLHARSPKPEARSPKPKPEPEPASKPEPKRGSPKPEGRRPAASGQRPAASGQQGLPGKSPTSPACFICHSISEVFFFGVFATPAEHREKQLPSIKVEHLAPAGFVARCIPARCAALLLCFSAYMFRTWFW